MVNFRFRSKLVFRSLPAVDPETPLISELEFFVITANDFQLLIIVVKVSAEFLNPHTSAKDDCTVKF